MSFISIIHFLFGISFYILLYFFIQLPFNSACMYMILGSYSFTLFFFFYICNPLNIFIMYYLSDYCIISQTWGCDTLIWLIYYLYLMMNCFFIQFYIFVVELILSGRLYFMGFQHIPKMWKYLQTVTLPLFLPKRFYLFL